MCHYSRRCCADFAVVVRAAVAAACSTAGLTGVVVVAMLVIRPESLLLGRAVLATAATVAIVCSVPARKGAAVSLNYFIETRAGSPGARHDPTDDS